jgi:uncharacterized protein YegP (UPF0339 family)
MSVTGNVITIVVLELIAALIGYLIAWRISKSRYIPVIKGLEEDKARLTAQAAGLKTELSAQSEKDDELGNKIAALEARLEKMKAETLMSSGKNSPIGKYELSQAKSGEYYFNLKATNGQVILTSPMFPGLDECKNGIETTREICTDDVRFDRKVSAGNKPYFNLTTPAGKIIGKSEIYESNSGMENGIASVKRNGPTTHVVEG